MLRPLLILLIATGAACFRAPTLGPSARAPATRRVTVGGPQMLGLPRASTAGWMVGLVVGGTAGVPAVVGATTTWYRKIPLPSWTPPDRVFAPTWTSLYAMMGLATARVAGVLGVGSATVLHFCMHYAVNLAWAPVFFGLQHLRLAFAMNLLLIGSLAVLVAQYAAVATSAAWLLVPYMAWLLFATALNAAICKLNPTAGAYNNARWQADVAKLQSSASRIAFA